MPSIFKSAFLLFLFFIIITEKKSCAEPILSDKMYFCAAADEKYFPLLVQLIGSIHKVNFDELEEIAIYDLGFTKPQRDALNAIAKVTVYDIELTHPDLLKIFKTNDEGKTVRGWYAWKPVAIKQALEKFPYVLYLDAGVVVLKPLNDLFKYIQERGYALFQDQEWFVAGTQQRFLVKNHCTNHVTFKFNLLAPENLWILEMPNMYAAMQGLSKTMYDSFVLPMYELTKDLRNFEDDGSCMGGFGWARHDQTLYSIQAHIRGLDLIEPHKEVPLMANGASFTIRVADNAEENPHVFYNCKGRMIFVDWIYLKNGQKIRENDELH